MRMWSKHRTIAAIHYESLESVSQKQIICVSVQTSLYRPINTVFLSWFLPSHLFSRCLLRTHIPHPPPHPPPASHPGSPQSLCPTVLDRVRPCHDGLLLCSFLFCRTPLTFLVTGEREEKEEWSRVEEKGWIYWRGARAQVDASPVGIMVDDEASGCQGQLHTGPGPHIHPSRSHFNAWKSTLSWPQNFSSSHKWLKAGIPIQHELPLGGAKKKNVMSVLSVF